ncbi:Peroxisome assembly protein 12 [Phytophthora cactorum]|nr:Peroxisome assembly protein 12 [Phytophthora cactorum]
MLFLEQTQGFAQEDSFKPAVEYLAHTLCESYPNLALTLPLRALRFCIERYFLSTYDSLATEKFYGMKRVTLHAMGVVVPYLKTKLDAYHKETAEQLARTRSTTSGVGTEQRMGNFLQRLRSFQYLRTLKKGFVATYPFAHFGYEGSFFLYQWLYLFGDTPYFSPFLRFMKTVLNEATYREKVLEKLAGPGLFDRVRRLALRATWATLDHSYVLLLLGVAGYKFVEWMYSEEGVAAKLRLTGTDAPIPPPPLPPQFSGQALTLATMDPTLCPLCKKKRVNPAMAPSGYVFCYPCIYHHVEKHGECPITQIKCEPATIVKIYDDARDP